MMLPDKIMSSMSGNRNTMKAVLDAYAYHNRKQLDENTWKVAVDWWPKDVVSIKSIILVKLHDLCDGLDYHTIELTHDEMNNLFLAALHGTFMSSISESRFYELQAQGYLMGIPRKPGLTLKGREYAENIILHRRNG